MVRAIDSGPKRRSCGTETVINVTILVPGLKQSGTETVIHLPSHAHDGKSNRHDCMLPFPIPEIC